MPRYTRRYAPTRQRCTNSSSAPWAPAQIPTRPPKPPTQARLSERSITMSAVFDFGAFPPEVNSAKMYAGPGSTSLRSAAAAWDGLASELRSQAANYASVVSNLTGEGWRGGASTAMAAGAAPDPAGVIRAAPPGGQNADPAQG